MQLRERKVIDLLVEKAEITEKTVSADSKAEKGDNGKKKAKKKAAKKSDDE